MYQDFLGGEDVKTLVCYGAVPLGATAHVVGGMRYATTVTEKNDRDTAYTTCSLNKPICMDFPALPIGCPPVLSFTYTTGDKTVLTPKSMVIEQSTGGHLICCTVYLTAAFKNIQERVGLLSDRPLVCWTMVPLESTQDQIRERIEKNLVNPVIEKFVQLCGICATQNPDMKEQAQHADDKVSLLQFMVMLSDRENCGGLGAFVRVQYGGRWGGGNTLLNFAWEHVRTAQKVATVVLDSSHPCNEPPAIGSSIVGLDFVKRATMTSQLLATLPGTNTSTLQSKPPKARWLFLTVAVGQEGSLSVNPSALAEHDKQVTYEQSKRKASAVFSASVSNLVVASSLAVKRARTLRLVRGDIDLGQPPTVHQAGLDAVCLNHPLLGVEVCAPMLLSNEGGNKAVCDSDPGIPLKDSGSPCARTLEYITAWVLMLSLQCKVPCSTQTVVDAVFAHQRFTNNADFEQKHVEFWAIACFVVKLHAFILVHVLDASEGGMCKLEFYLPPDPVTDATPLCDALFASAAGIATEYSPTFNAENMGAAKGVLDRYTVEGLKNFACCYCRLAGCAGNATWDETRAYFRRFMNGPAQLDPDEAVDEERKARMGAALRVLLKPSE